MEAPHHMAIRELDLSAYHPNPLVDRVNAMPGLKTSAGRHPFFSLSFCYYCFLLHFLLHTALCQHGRCPLRAQGPCNITEFFFLAFVTLATGIISNPGHQLAWPCGHEPWGP